MSAESTRYAADTAIVRDAAMSTASMTLFHNPLSPYVRKVMVLLHETGQQDRVALQASVLTPVSPDAAPSWTTHWAKFRHCAWPMAASFTTAG